MKYKLFVSTVLIQIIFLCSQNLYSAHPDSLSQSKTSQLLNEIKREFAPDSRLALFDVKLNCDTSETFILSGKTNQTKAIVKLEEILKSEHIAFDNKITLLPSLNLGNKIYGVANHSVINLRTEPDHAAEMSSQALLGMPVLILEESNGWYRVQTPDNYIAWTEKSSVSAYNKLQMNNWTSEQKIVFWSDYGFSYEKPNVKSQRVSDLTMGNVLKCIEKVGKFVKVEYPDSRIAYIEKSNCKDFNEWIDSPNPTRPEIAATALKLMGIPYLWGGTSLKALDCSGFTKTIYYLHGIIIQRDASQQARWGSLIETENSFESVQVGDLLFFGKKISETQKESITHVGLYLGDLRFIDAAGNISLRSFDPNDKLFTSYRLRNFIKAKEYINNIGAEGITKIKDSPFYNLR